MWKNDGHNGWASQLTEARVDSGARIMGAAAYFCQVSMSLHMTWDTEGYKQRRSDFTQSHLTHNHAKGMTLHMDPGKEVEINGESRETHMVRYT